MNLVATEVEDKIAGLAAVADVAAHDNAAVVGIVVAVRGGGFFAADKAVNVDLDVAAVATVEAQIVGIGFAGSWNSGGDSALPSYDDQRNFNAICRVDSSCLRQSKRVVSISIEATLVT